jgi:hypothetical protein
MGPPPPQSACVPSEHSGPPQGDPAIVRDGETLTLGVKGQSGYCARMIGRMGLRISVCAKQTHFPADGDRSRLRRAGDRQHIDLASWRPHQFRDAAVFHRPDQSAVIPAAEETPSVEIKRQAQGCAIMRLHGLDGAAWPDELNGAVAQGGG